MEAGRYPAAEQVSWENAVSTKAEPLSNFMEIVLSDDTAIALIRD
jgi:hypothetical protein